MSTTSPFGTVEAFAGDPILSLNQQFQADPRPEKVNLSIGVYTDAAGKLPLLATVREAQNRITDRTRPYLPMEGDAGYRSAVQALVFGADHPALAARRIATVQSVGGTGAVAVAADFLAKHTPSRAVYISDPTWDNHHGLFQRAGFKTQTYPYWDASRRGLDFAGMLGAIEAAAPGSIFVIQPVCHNPTGVDLNPEQQAKVTEACATKGHIVVFDMAYQGFGRGLDEDAAFVRNYARTGAVMLVATSFSKNLSLYGERCGALSILCTDADEAERVLGQLKLAIRRSYSNPPFTGGLLVSTVLNDPELKARWVEEVAEMRDRMNAMRQALAAEIRKISPNAPTAFLTEQLGMFSYTGITADEVRRMREEDGVFLVGSGRMCVGGLNPENVARVARSMVTSLTR